MKFRDAGQFAFGTGARRRRFGTLQFTFIGIAAMSMAAFSPRFLGGNMLSTNNSDLISHWTRDVIAFEPDECLTYRDRQALTLYVRAEESFGSGAFRAAVDLLRAANAYPLILTDEPLPTGESYTTIDATLMQLAKRILQLSTDAARAHDSKSALEYLAIGRRLVAHVDQTPRPSARSARLAKSVESVIRSATRHTLALLS